MSIKTTGITAQFRIDAGKPEEVFPRGQNSRVAGGYDKSVEKKLLGVGGANQSMPFSLKLK